MYHFFLIFILILWTPCLSAANVYDTYFNHRYGYAIEYPKNVLFPQGESDNGDGQVFLSKNTDARLSVYASYNALEQSLEEIYREQSRGGTPEEPQKVVTYHLLKDNWFVVSGYNRGKIFYRKTILHDNELKTFIFEYDEKQKSLYEPMLKRLAKSFKG